MFLSYRDPLFGILEFFLLVFAIASLSHIYNLYKHKKNQREYAKLLRRFKLNRLKEDDYIHLYQTYNLPFESILLLATSFVKNGNTNKAISVYLSLLDIVSIQLQKEQLLELLGDAYLKTGMLQRAREIYLKVLKFSPRNVVALDSLFVIYEKLHMYDKILEILDVFEAIQHDKSFDRLYIQTLRTIANSTNCPQTTQEALVEILSSNIKLTRPIAMKLLSIDMTIFWSCFHLYDIESIIDILWQIDKANIDMATIDKYSFLAELYTAKGYITKAKSSENFHLNIVINLVQNENNTATIGFKYTCQKCKKVLPLAQNRCPVCHDVLSLKPTLGIIRQKEDTNDSLL